MEKWPTYVIDTIFYVSFAINMCLYIYLAVKVSLYISGKSIKHLKLASVLFKTYTYVNFIASIYASLCIFDR